MTDNALRVVVADDEPDVRMLLELQLAMQGCTVVGTAADGREAVDVCERERPDGIVLDLLMPKMSGIEAIPQLRSAQPDLAIVAYTAVAADFVREEMQRLDVRLELKSGDPVPLVEALWAEVGRRRTR